MTDADVQNIIQGRSGGFWQMLIQEGEESISTTALFCHG
jgi:hypothetical protein